MTPRYLPTSGSSTLPDTLPAGYTLPLDTLPLDTPPPVDTLYPRYPNPPGYTVPPRREDLDGTWDLRYPIPWQGHGSRDLEGTWNRRYPFLREQTDASENITFPCGR